MLDIVASIGRVWTYYSWVHHCQISCHMTSAILWTTMCHAKYKQYLNERHKTIRKKIFDNVRSTVQLFTNYMNLKYQTMYLSSQCYPTPSHHFTSGTSVVDEVSVIILKFHGSGLHLIITSRRFMIEQTNDPHSLSQLQILPKKTSVQNTMNIALCCQRISF